MRVVILKEDHEYPAPALIDALREAGVLATLDSCARATHPGAAGEADAPFAVIYEVADGAGVLEIHAAVARASEVYTRAELVACRRSLPAENHVDGRRLDAATLTRLGFRAVADDPAQVPALLRELESRGGNTGELPPVSDELLNAAPASVLLPDNVGVAALRAAFEAVSSLHFVTDQTSAAQTALAGLAPLARADRLTIYLTEIDGDDQRPRFEPIAVRGLTAREREPPADDVLPRVLQSDALLSLTGRESRAARESFASTETVRLAEGDRQVLAAPLVNADRVLGVVEAVREGAQARAFTDDEKSLLSAVAVPVAAALANSVRIAEAERLSLTDDLTKLHNARFLRQYLTAEIKRARRYGNSLAALFLDLDDFKEINDRHGHLAGSHVLMEMATVILTAVRDTDIVARYGGDEFVVALPETGLDLASRVAERVRERIAGHRFNGGRRLRLHVTASFGVATFPLHAQSPQQLVASADAAMYEAKAARKNCVRYAGE
jgi:diguanylate cyclase (GGDEF)-like protein